MNIVKIKDIEDKVLLFRNEKVLLDSDVAEIYGVETKRINEAEKINSEKFPNGYILELDKNDLEYLRSKFSTAKLTKTRTIPKAFTERGLYMLATILKGKLATQTTLSIIDTFYKIRELSHNVLYSNSQLSL